MAEDEQTINGENETSEDASGDAPAAAADAPASSPASSPEGSQEAAAGTMTPEQMREAAAASVNRSAAAIVDLAGGGRTEPHENTLLEVQDLKMYFPVTAGLLLKRKVADIKAVDGISFSVREGETLGLVGESGCGKSTTGRAILQLYRPTAGNVLLSPPRYTSHIVAHADQNGGDNGADANGGENSPAPVAGGPVDLTTLSGRNLRAYRRQMQMIFQDPYASLNPRMSVGSIVAEPMVIHGLQRGRRKERVRELLETVGLNPYFASRYPHEFSGGQRQRIGVARALAVEPAFIVADEPVSALDVSIQAQIINLLEDLQSDFGLTYLFIAHDLSVVRHISHRIAVMYLGKIVELAPADELYENPLHPYTQALISAVPIPDPAVERRRERLILTGDVPNPIAPPPGCNFHTRCPIAIDVCREEDPEWREIGTEHYVRCHRV